METSFPLQQVHAEKRNSSHGSDKDNVHNRSNPSIDILMDSESTIIDPRLSYQTRKRVSILSRLQESIFENSFEAPSPDSVYATSKFRLTLVMIGLCFGAFLTYLDMTIVATALPVIGAELQSFGDISWVATSYLLTATALQPLYGKLADIFGRLPVLMFALVTFLVGCTICGVAQTMLLLIIARGLSGIGSAGMMAMAMIIVSDLVPLSKRTLFLSVFGAMFALASVSGPLLGGVLTDKVTWRWIFYINLPIGAVAIVIVLLFLRIPHQRSSLWSKLGRIDYLGTGTLVAGVVFLLLGLMWGGNTYPWSDVRIITFLSLAAALLVAFVIVELKVSKEPVIPMYLFANRNTTLCFSSTFCMGMAIFGTLYYTPVFFNVVHNDTATVAGAKLLPYMLSMVVGNFISGTVINKTGNYRPILWVGSAMSTVGAGLLTTLNSTSTVGHEAGYLLIAGMGLGLCFQTLIVVTQTSVPEEDVAVVTACYSFFQTIGATIGVAVLSAALNNVLRQRLVLVQGLDLNMALTNPGRVYHMDLDSDQLHQFIDSYVVGIRSIFRVMIPVCGLIFAFSLGLKHIPLREHVGQLTRSNEKPGTSDTNV
ncbi:hypothetical protein IWQ62_003054 [Dispira parvispora]|uniref:Major facilitator superfamily (MFS) profile domain-containing protein n=1 Tax=Dispira parvispora TaxID=1520584 RepID=A0A9W8AUG9_9FUNG|nr:hypothetical protein IWQ62_003054 [Dispira parvispora]